MNPTEETHRGENRERSGHSEADAEAHEIATAAKAYTVGGDGSRVNRFNRHANNRSRSQGAE
jgi:hypothetical protein